MRIGYFGDGPWAHRAFDQIIDDQKLSIVFVVLRNDSQDEVMKAKALQHDLPVFYPQNVNSEDFLAEIKKYEADLFLSLSYNQIFKTKLINTPPLKTINCHAGKLPFYRGRNILNWVLINDEKEFGITVHFMDEGIDTGDIILQKNYEITDEDTYATLLEKAHKECADLTYEALLLFEKGEVKRLKQSEIHAIGLYCGMRTVGDENLNWDCSSREVFNFIRGICPPGPGARSKYKGKEVQINTVQIIPEAPNYIGTPGQILGKGEKGFYIKTKDSFVELIDWTSESKLRIGDRFE